MSIGKIRRVKLTEVWKHEAHDFTTWLEDNTDPLCQGSCRLLGSAFLPIRQLTIGGVMERRHG